jgi:hypothetical protein
MSVVISGYEVRVWFLAGLEIWIHSWKTYTTDDIIWHPGYWIYTETYTTVDLFFFGTRHLSALMIHASSLNSISKPIDSQFPASACNFGPSAEKARVSGRVHDEGHGAS